MRSLLFLILVLATLTCNVAHAAGGITGNFFPAPASTLQNTATTGGVIVTFTAAAAVGSSDVLIKNGGAVSMYCDIGLASAGFTATTVPTNTVPGGFLINAGEANIFNKRANDSVACITASGSAIFTATPGIGS